VCFSCWWPTSGFRTQKSKAAAIDKGDSDAQYSSSHDDVIRQAAQQLIIRIPLLPQAMAELTPPGVTQQVSNDKSFFVLVDQWQQQWAGLAASIQ